MSGVDVAFIIFSAIAVVGAVLVVWLPNVLHAAVSLIVSFFGVAGLYAILSADFVAVSQVLIYIGGVVVLIVFAIMLSERLDNVPGQEKARQQKLVMAGTIGVFVLITFYLVVYLMPWKPFVEEIDFGRSTVRALGDLLLTDYVLPFEIASVLLLAALIGAVIIARQRQ